MFDLSDIVVAIRNYAIASYVTAETIRIMETGAEASEAPEFNFEVVESVAGGEVNNFMGEYTLTTGEITRNFYLDVRSTLEEQALKLIGAGIAVSAVAQMVG